MSIKHGTSRFFPRGGSGTSVGAEPLWHLASPYVVNLIDLGSEVAIGASTMLGAEKLRVVGGLAVDDAAGSAAFMEWRQGSAAGVAPSGAMRFRYNEGANLGEVSFSGAAYVPLVAPAGGAPASATSLVSHVAYTCLASVSVGDAVYVAGGDYADKASANTGSLHTADGVVATKPTANTCHICYHGEISAFTGLIPGAIYYLSPVVPGGLAIYPPSRESGAVQRLGVARNATTLLLNPQVVPQILKERHVLTLLDVENGFILLGDAAIPNSLVLWTSRVMLAEGDDYTVSYGGALTRVSFIGALAVGGISGIEIGDVIHAVYAIGA
ncbi:MAG: hypothetical protein EXQ69_04315 [Acidimicrobiia bacterium]|nr:hypothetical protein [Acidimicrobiia bacterium]